MPGRVSTISYITYACGIIVPPLTPFPSYFTDMNRACNPSVKKRWFSDLVCPDNAFLIGTFTSRNKQPLPSLGRVSGFQARQGDVALLVADRVRSVCLQRTVFIQHETWMESFTLEGVSITPASLLLNFRPKQSGEQEKYPADDSHGVLCLFSFSSKEYVYHW